MSEGSWASCLIISEARSDLQAPEISADLVPELSILKVEIHSFSARWDLRLLQPLWIEGAALVVRHKLHLLIASLQILRIITYGNH